MATVYPANPPAARAPAARHPLHIVLAAFPIAYFIGAFVTDIVYANTAEMMWANFSVWMITAGLIMGFIAAAVGLIDVFLVRRGGSARRDRWAGSGWHSVGNALVLILSLFNVLVHSRDAYTSVVPTGLILSGIVSVLVLVTAWLGTAIVEAPAVEEVQ